MTLTQLFIFPSMVSLSEQLELLERLTPAELQPIFHSADLSVVNGDITENTISPLQIEQVRQLQLNILHAPLQYSRRLIVIANIELASLPAQNALLKLLEEPPAHAQLLATTSDLSGVLETVQSRSQVIQLTRGEVISEELPLDDELRQLLQTYPAKTLTLTQVFKLSEEYKDRPQALSLLTAVAAFLHSRLRAHPSPKLVQQLQAALSALQQLEKNANVRLVIEQFFFQFVPTKS
ncbi:hypothetical protein H3C70_03920 [Patescibacteria group bacterium]|nr:hypothetical protein [Patescibacteria group bacterium]